MNLVKGSPPTAATRRAIVSERSRDRSRSATRRCVAKAWRGVVRAAARDPSIHTRRHEIGEDRSPEPTGIVGSPVGSPSPGAEAGGGTEGTSNAAAP